MYVNYIPVWKYIFTINLKLYNRYQHYLLEKEENGQLVIVAAPSNTAIDIIVKNLVKFIPRREILRLVSVANSTKIDQDIELVSTVEANDVIERFEDGELKVLCGTLQILGKIPEARVKATHIIIDEAGQANEGEIFNEAR